MICRRRLKWLPYSCRNTGWFGAHGMPDSFHRWMCCNFEAGNFWPIRFLLLSHRPECRCQWPFLNARDHAESLCPQWKYLGILGFLSKCLGVSCWEGKGKGKGRVRAGQGQRESFTIRKKRSQSRLQSGGKLQSNDSAGGRFCCLYASQP